MSKQQWSSERIVEVLREMKAETGLIPRANTNPALTQAVFRHFGKWNRAVEAAFGGLDTEKRYKELDCPLSDDLIKRVEAGEFSSRRELYKARPGGRSHRLVAWLDERGLLMPDRWTRERVILELRKAQRLLGRVPRSKDVSDALLTAAQRHFGTWNEALYQAFGAYNQRRYDHLSNSDLLEIIRKYVIKYQRLPTRGEFNGGDYPDWETYARRLGVSSWSEVIGLVDLSGIKYFSQHGWGRRYVHNGLTYLSHEEWLIGKFLTQRSIRFAKEVPYGNCDFIFDFHLLDYDTYIEYFGIATDEYQERVETKQSYYAERHVIEIFKHDNTLDKLATEVQRLQSSLAA